MKLFKVIILVVGFACCGAGAWSMVGSEKAIFQAVKDGYSFQVEAILAGDKEELYAQDSEGNTPLLVALKNDKDDIAKLLVEQDYKKDIYFALSLENKIGERAIHLAAKKGCQQAIEAILKKNKYELYTQDSDGNTPLLVALKNDKEEIAKFLVENDYRPFTYASFALEDHNNDGERAIHLAAKKGYSDVVKAILEVKPHEANTEDKSGLIPLDIAIKNNHQKIADLLRPRTSKKYQPETEVGRLAGMLSKLSAALTALKNALGSLVPGA